MAESEVFVNQENMALFRCPYCEKMKHVSVAKFKNVKHSLQVKCSCGKTFVVDLNFRKKFRKDTKLDGTFRKVSSQGKEDFTGKEGVNCKIVNISLGGLGLLLLGSYEIKLGDTLLVLFTLDDKKKSEIKRKVIVRYVGERGGVGTEFSSDDGHAYEKTIGFYLMP